MNVMLKSVENTWDDLELHYEIGKQNSPNWSLLQCNMLKNFKIMNFSFFFCRNDDCYKKNQQHNVLDEKWHKQTRLSLDYEKN